MAFIIRLPLLVAAPAPCESIPPYCPYPFPSYSHCSIDFLSWSFSHGTGVGSSVDLPIGVRFLFGKMVGRHLWCLWDHRLFSFGEGTVLLDPRSDPSWHPPLRRLVRAFSSTNQLAFPPFSTRIGISGVRSPSSRRTRRVSFSNPIDFPLEREFSTGSIPVGPDVGRTIHVRSHDEPKRSDLRAKQLASATHVRGSRRIERGFGRRRKRRCWRRRKDESDGAKT